MQMFHYENGKDGFGVVQGKPAGGATVAATANPAPTEGELSKKQPDDKPATEPSPTS